MLVPALATNPATMGITSLSAMLKKRVGRESLKGKLNGETLAVDGSVIIHQIIATEHGSAQVLHEPVVPQTHVGKAVVARMKKLMTLGAKIIFVFDGITDHVLKRNGIGQRRLNDAAIAKESLQKEISKPVPTNRAALAERRAEIVKYRKKVAHVTPAVMVAVADELCRAGIPYLVAPFEADHQCVYLFEMGIVTGILTTDSDLYGAGKGGASLLMEIGWEKMDAFIVSKRRLADGARNKHLTPMTPAEAIVVAATRGCDYLVGGTKGIGATTFSKISEEAGSRSGRDLDRAMRKTTRISDAQRANYAANHEFISNAFASMPVFDATVAQGKVVVTDILNVSGKQLSSSEFQKFVSFDPFAELYKKYTGPASSRPSYQDIANMKWIASKGISRKDAMPIPPKDPNNSNKVLPFGAIVDFDKCRPEYQPDGVLTFWLSVRGFIPRRRHNTAKIVNAMKDRADIPIMSQEEADALIPRNRKYVGYEVIVPGAKAAVWSGRNFEVNASKLEMIDAKLICKIFGKHNGVRRRAIKWVKHGHYYYDSLRCARARTASYAGKESRDILLFRVEAMSSQRKKVYTVHLAFDESNGRYLPAPYSRCRCAAGRLFCAHMLGFCLLIREFQKRPDLTVDRLVRTMPTHVEKIQRVVTPVQTIMRKRRV